MAVSDKKISREGIRTAVRTFFEYTVGALVYVVGIFIFSSMWVFVPLFIALGLINIQMAHAEDISAEERMSYRKSGIYSIIVAISIVIMRIIVRIVFGPGFYLL